MNINDLAHALIPVAQQAGAAIMQVYDDEHRPHYKSDRSPVTDADHAAEEIILGALARIAPGIAAVAEEQASLGHIPEIGSSFFLVDPLDGTKEFLKRNGEFTVNIALITDLAPVFGLVYAPAFGDCYVTMTASQVMRFQLPPAKTPTAFEDLAAETVNPPSSGGQGLIAIVSRSHQNAAAREFLSRLPIAGLREMGSSLKFCALARGEADIYPRFTPTNEWDIAAGHAILNATGGCVRSERGEPLTYGKKEENFLNPPFLAWRRVSDAESVLT